MRLKSLYLSSIFLLLGANLLAQTYQTNWVYKKTSNELKNIQLVRETGSVDMIYLDFSGDKKNLLGLFTTQETKQGVYKSPLKVNKKLFSGEIEARDANGRLAFQALFEKGIRRGEFLTLSEKGDTQKLFFNYPDKPVEHPNVRPAREMPYYGRGGGGLKPKKPVIYLYPNAPTSVTVKLQNAESFLSHTYPKYNPAAGWQVTAQPNGNLQDIHTQKEYYALFWEGKAGKPFSLEEGFSVAGAETANFLDTKLAELGLNRREANEFIMFWLPQMENNPYNTIHFAAESYTERYPLEISPRPDALIRVFMVFQPTNEPVKIPAQTFKTPIRKGFTVVEWGGTEQPKQEK